MMYFLFFIFCVVLTQTGTNGQEQTCTLGTIDFSNCHQDLSKKYFCSLTQEQQSWLKSLWQAALKDKSMPIRKRRELRMLNEHERLAFFNALNNLKNDTTIKPNKFDTLALIHSNWTLCSAHRGSNFLGWHRVYLLLFETAIRQKDPSVVLPYWDSVLDNHNLTDAKQTVIFTDAFLGNGDGSVNSGPFAHWRDVNDCPLQREVMRATHTELPSPSIINTIEYDIKVRHVTDVIDYVDSKEVQLTTIEGQHNLPHEWIGGMMDDLNSSAKDPVFILHHAFIDYVWEKFRLKQMRLGESPEYYPDLGKVSKTNNYNLTSFHTTNRTMDCFPWMTNQDGYLNNYVGILYEYEDSPTCPDCGNSKYLTCNPELQRCIGSTPLAPPQSTSDWFDIAKYIFISVGVAIVVVPAIIYLVCRYFSKRKGYTRV